MHHVCSPFPAWYGQIRRSTPMSSDRFKGALSGLALGALHFGAGIVPDIILISSYGLLPLTGTRTCH